MSTTFFACPKPLAQLEKIIWYFIAPFSAAYHKVNRNLQAVIKMWDGEVFSPESKPKTQTTDTQTDPDIFFKMFGKFEMEDTEDYRSGH